MKMLTALLLLLPYLASADTSDPIQYLKNEQVSMLDFGIKAANDYFRRYEGSFRETIALNDSDKIVMEVFTQVYYDTTSDLIVVYTEIWTPDLLSDNQCKRIIGRQRTSVSIGLPRWFLHADEENEDAQTYPTDYPAAITKFPLNQRLLDIYSRFEFRCRIVRGLTATHHQKAVGSSGPSISLMEDDE